MGSDRASKDFYATGGPVLERLGLPPEVGDKGALDGRIPRVVRATVRGERGQSRPGDGA